MTTIKTPEMESRGLDVGPDDSASQVSGRSGSSSAARVRAIAKKAAVAAQMEVLRQQQELELQELRLKQRLIELELESKMRSFEAEERVYAELGSAVSAHRSTGAYKSRDALPERSSDRHAKEGLDHGAQDDRHEETLAYPIPGANSTPEDQPQFAREARSEPDPPASTIPLQRPELPRFSQDETHVHYFPREQGNTPFPYPDPRYLIDMMNLPNPEMMKFDGNPMRYHEFMSCFDNTVLKSSIDSGGKLLRLYHLCEGDARRVIQSCMAMEPSEGFVRARQLLAERFGAPYTIGDAWLRKVTEGKPIRADDVSGLLRFSDELRTCYETLNALNLREDIGSQRELARIVDRLPNHLRNSWLKTVRYIRRQNLGPDIGDLARFVSEAAMEVNDPVFGRHDVVRERKSSKPRSSGDFKRTKGSFSTAGQEEGTKEKMMVDQTKEKDKSKEKPKPNCVLCSEAHTLFSCQKFKDMAPSERLDLARKERLCFNCLKYGHRVDRCNLNRTCTVKGCNRKHTRFLHVGRPEVESPTETSTATGAGGSRMGLPIVPVRVSADDVQVDTYALLDSGSTSTFCTEGLRERLLVTGVKQNLRLSTLHGDRRNLTVQVVSLQVKGLGVDAGEFIDLPRVYVKKQLNISISHLASFDDIRSYSHLSDLDLARSDTNKIELLIGQDANLIPLDVKAGEPGEPFAVRTKLGWAVNGPLDSEGSGNDVSSNFVDAGGATLDQQLKRFWEIDSPDPLVSDQRGMSTNDRTVLQMWNDSSRMVEGHHELPIPFKDRPPQLENNRMMAEQRLSSLRRRLLKDGKLHTKYADMMEDLLTKGYAEAVVECPESVAEGPEWYIPHHPVFSQSKPDKVRIVFDCAAKHHGLSLNDVVLQGPQMTNNLQAVLLNFRKESVALISDVEAMFHQVRVPVEDRDVLRFLWWPGGDLEQTPRVYRMCAHLFGGTWSPSACSFALKKTADDHKDEFPDEVVQTVKQNFYVDDCLVSVATESEAVKLAEDLRCLLAKGGFRLSKWLSNNPNVLDSIPVKDRAKKLAGLDFSSDALPMERALGVQWDVEQDCFTYSVVMKDKPLTRRGMLSVIASVYDPQGYAAPFVMSAKILLQELTALKIGWDEPLPQSLRQRWEDWQQDLTNMEKCSVNRCLKPQNFDVKEYQLHHFSDASEKGYGAVSYLRLVNADGQVHSGIIMAKSRLTPLKKATVPRLELMAATVAVKMEVFLRRELDLPLMKSVFWTDSTIVLHYLRNEDKRFKTFVANRIAMIKDVTKSSQWRHVGTRLNPADDITRGMSASDLLERERWWLGPSFIFQPEDRWPDEYGTLDSVDDADLEVKKEPANPKMFATELNGDVPTERLLCYFSDWHRLKRAVARILQFKRYLQSKVQRKAFDCSKSLIVDDLVKAEQAVLRYVQEQSFPEEMEVLQLDDGKSRSTQKSRVKKSSSLSKLNPQIFDDGLIHVGGRIQNAAVKDETKHPIILPKMHHVVRLIIKQVHEMAGHSGREYVLSSLRRKFWILRGRVAVRQVLRDCRVCKRTSATAKPQMMADLPSDRVEGEKPPFTNVGVDCFGPFMIKQGRSVVKRYGCIFTCLVVRAVHIEILHSMETDSFINALQRFVARRGQPELIRSDNGTNFVGAERELRDGIRAWNQQKIQDHLLRKGIDWRFNTPTASHMGGSWERQIRTVRKVLSALLKQQTLTDESLCTLMCLVEATINGRPLTVVSDDSRDPEPITPNHLLLLRENNVFPSDVIGKNDQYSRRRWRQVQYLADVFWRRWTREYLPALQQRGKWSAPVNNLATGDVVLIVEDLPRNQWMLGRVIETFAGKDGLVRTAKVKTKSSTLVRPVHKLCLLESSE